MQRSPAVLEFISALALLTTLASTGHAAIARDIEERTEALRHAADPPAATQQILDLQAAIKRGEDASKELRGNIRALEEQKQSLQEEVRKLEKVQTILASGLIGALVTAGVAILGVLGNARRSRAERDLKRLEVLEKAGALQAKGLTIPSDIESEYGITRP